MVIRKFVIAIITKYTDKGVKKANRDLKELAKQAKKAALGVKALDKAQDQASRSAVKTAAAAKKAGAAAKKAGRGARLAAFDFKKLGEAMKSLAPIGAAAVKGFATLATGVAAIGAGVLITGTKFESMRAQLGNLLGGEEQAAEAFKQIQDFAKNTPFQVDAITTAFIKLTNQGIDPTEERLTAFGDIAAANGKELDDFTEAVLDAAVGENERLKEFGIKAKAMGDNVAFTFRGQTIEVEKNADAITKALVGFGQMEGIAGSMAVQMETAGGKISNLKDSFFNFLDTVAKLGVLDEFKLLLEDIGAVGGDGEGLAGTLADSLITVLRSLREIIQSITKEDVEGFFQAISDVAGTLADAILAAGEALRWFTDQVGSSDEALKLMALAALAVVAAFTGPAGIVIAAGLVGVAIGRMLGDWAFGMDEVDARMEAAQVRIDAMRAKIKASNDAIDETIRVGKRRQEALDKTNAETLAKSRERIKKDIGGLGVGLAAGGGEFDDEQALLKGFQGPEGRAAREALLTAEGKTVLASVDAAAAKKVADASKRARREAIRSGASKAEADRAAAAARTATQASTLAGREKAFEAATKTFGETGSARAAAKAGAEAVTGKKRKGKAGADPFDFRKKAEAAAKTQAVKFSEEEIKRLVASGLDSTVAIRQAAEAGREKQDELLAKFLKAGEIFDAGTSTNILDVLGLRGPGAVMEKRPAPQTLIINLNVVVKMIERLEMKIVAAAGTTLGENAAAAGEQISAALEGALSPVAQAVKSIFEVNAEALVNQQGGGRQLPGVSGA
jgi:hypothetical protein